MILNESRRLAAAPVLTLERDSSRRFGCARPLLVRRAGSTPRRIGRG